LEYRLNAEFPKPSEGAAMKGDQKVYVDILTPQDPEQRGAQLSVQLSLAIAKIFIELKKRGVGVNRFKAAYILCL